MKEIHFSKKDFILEWFSGTGAGGQHRNKHKNCCRITHIESGLKTQGTHSRERPANQKSAFEELAKKILEYYYGKEKKERIKSKGVIRNYHAVRNEVHDKASNLKMSYKEIVIGGDLEKMIKARRIAFNK